MTRLFLSLYLFIAISIVALTAGLERVFFSPTDELDNGQLLWLKTFETLRNNESQLFTLLDNSQLDYQRFDIESLALTRSLHTQLKNGNIVQGFTDNTWQLYIPLSANAIVQIEFPQDERTTSNWWLYSGIFFALLGGVIAIWLYPLWRDLTRISASTRQMGNDGTLELPTISSRSPLHSIHDALRGLSERVGVLLRNQRELTGAVTHEFRTPLARLKFALADKSHLTAVQLNAIESDINELEQLVQEMLDFSRLDIHEPELHIEAIPLFELCQQRIRNIPSSTGIEIELKGEKPIYNGDGHLIARAVDNLLSNAVRHSRQRIIVSITSTAKGIELVVEDDGNGISVELHNKIFDPFYRPDGARDRASGGAGLGLAIVNRIQQWHSAKCWVESSTLGGAKFVLFYPTTA